MSMPNLPTQFGENSDCPECAISLVVTRKKMSIFFACHRGLSCVHVMHHSSKTNARTHTWNNYGPSDNKKMQFDGKVRFGENNGLTCPLSHESPEVHT